MREIDLNDPSSLSLNESHLASPEKRSCGFRREEWRAVRVPMGVAAPPALGGGRAHPPCPETSVLYDLAPLSLFSKGKPLGPTGTEN